VGSPPEKLLVRASPVTRQAGSVSTNPIAEQPLPQPRLVSASRSVLLSSTAPQGKPSATPAQQTVSAVVWRKLSRVEGGSNRSGSRLRPDPAGDVCAGAGRGGQQFQPLREGLRLEHDALSDGAHCASAAARRVRAGVRRWGRAAGHERWWRWPGLRQVRLWAAVRLALLLGSSLFMARGGLQPTSSVCYAAQSPSFYRKPMGRPRQHWLIQRGTDKSIRSNTLPTRACHHATTRSPSVDCPCRLHHDSCDRQTLPERARVA